MSSNYFSQITSTSWIVTKSLSFTIIFRLIWVLILQYFENVAYYSHYILNFVHKYLECTTSSTVLHLSQIHETYSLQITQAVVGVKYVPHPLHEPLLNILSSTKLKLSLINYSCIIFLWYGTFCIKTNTLWIYLFNSYKF